MAGSGSHVAGVRRAIAIGLWLVGCAGAGHASSVAAPRVEASDADEIRTQPFTPVRRVISIDELPPPDADAHARNPPRLVPPPRGATLRAPEGFRVNVFADDVESARWPVRTPGGEILVAASREDRIVLLADRDGDGVAEERAIFADADRGDPLDIPFGMAFSPDGRTFFLGNQGEVRRFPYRPGDRRLRGPGERITELPAGGYHQHWTRNVVLAPDGEHLFVSIGSVSNDDPEPLPRASIQVMRLDGSERRTFAHGLRNPVGLALHPRTRALWATVNERDGLGDDLVPDYLAHVEEGRFYGWPWVYFRPDLPNPHLDGRDPPPIVAETVAPEVLFQAHSAALGIAFYDGDRFPARYRGDAFVAFRGSWNRDRATGYQIVRVPFDDEGRPEGGYEPFVDGFLLDPAPSRVWGRPVGVVVAPDGSLLFTEEMGGRVYRVSWTSE